MATTFQNAAAQALTNAADSQGQSTQSANGYKHFLDCLELWEAMLPKRAGDEASGTLMARGFWMMIGSKLTEAEMTQLTERVLDRCKWFPSVAECKEIMAEQSYANPFYRKARAQLLDHHGYPKLAAPVRQLADDR